jgi:hypothetical protein
LNSKLPDKVYFTINEYNLKDNSIVNIFRNTDKFLDDGIITKDYMIVESNACEL